MIKHKINKLPDNFDSDDVIFIDDQNNQIGSGYVSKKNPQHICIIKCPSCHHENYAMAVSSGYCAWCNYTANQGDSHETV